MISKLDAIRDLSWAHSCPHCEPPTGGEFCDTACMRAYWAENAKAQRDRILAVSTGLQA